MVQHGMRVTRRLLELLAIDEGSFAASEETSQAKRSRLGACDNCA
jgi:hypothetical protein